MNETTSYNFRKVQSYNKFIAALAALPILGFGVIAIYTDVYFCRIIYEASPLTLPVLDILMCVLISFILVAGTFAFGSELYDETINIGVLRALRRTKKVRQMLHDSYDELAVNLQDCVQSEDLSNAQKMSRIMEISETWDDLVTYVWWYISANVQDFMDKDSMNKNLCSSILTVFPTSPDEYGNIGGSPY